MHGSIRNRLEDLLGAEQLTDQHDASRHLINDASRHLSSCPDCVAEVRKMHAQSELLKSLRVPEPIEPSAGFYARVLQRIEEQARESIWAAFIYSPFANRLLYASLTVALVLGSYVVAHERQDGHLRSGMVAENVQTAGPVFGDRSAQRDAVLANFEAY